MKPNCFFISMPQYVFFLRNYSLWPASDTLKSESESLDGMFSGSSRYDLSWCSRPCSRFGCTEFDLFTLAEARSQLNVFHCPSAPSHCADC